MVQRITRWASCIIVVLCLLSVPVYLSYASEEGSGELTKEEAALLLKQLSPEIEVVSVKAGPIEGLWEIIIKARGQINILYIDSSRQNVFLGSIVNIATKMDLTKVSLAEARKIDFSEIPLEGALVMGKKDAKHKVVVFDDPD